MSGVMWKCLRAGVLALCSNPELGIPALLLHGTQGGVVAAVAAAGVSSFDICILPLCLLCPPHLPTDTDPEGHFRAMRF